MKMKPEHLKFLRQNMMPLDTAARRAAYIAGQFPNADKVKNLAKRYRWDLLWMTVPAAWVTALYVYLDDDHIDTALRVICHMDHRSALKPEPPFTRPVTEHAS